MNNSVSCSVRSGVVSKITNESIAVNILSLSACSACHAKEFCSAFEQKEKTVIVPNVGQQVCDGDTVNVTMKNSLGLKAVLLAYILPVVCVLIILPLLVEAGISEPWAGLLSLSSLAIYYFILYLFKNKLKKQFSFYIEKAVQ